eukprot:Nitzschia sp. Nitz4//scaffold20_size174350//118393//119562//NITZ4_002116-RA/size174350-processed-gene-0.110-mRNA-1//-1//CDS//3329541851//8574//frame0
MYSTNYASIKYLETTCDQPPCHHDPADIAFSRFLVAAMVCLPILYVHRHQLPLIRAGLECGLSVSINYICQAKALEVIPAGKCCFIGTLSVVSVPLMNVFFLGRPLTSKTLLSAGVALVGVALLEQLIPIPGLAAATATTTTTSTTTTTTTSSWGFSMGDWLAMGQPIGFGYAVMRMDYYLELYAHYPNRALTMTAAQCVAVCCLTFVWVLVDHDGHVPDLRYMLEIHHVLALGWTGIVTSVGAILLQGLALQGASATDAALIFCTEPILATMFANWLLNEQPSASTFVGGAVIVSACILGSLADTGGSSTGASSTSAKANTNVTATTSTTGRGFHHRILKSKQSTDTLLPTVVNTVDDSTTTTTAAPPPPPPSNLSLKNLPTVKNTLF